MDRDRHQRGRLYFLRVKLSGKRTEKGKQSCITLFLSFFASKKGYETSFVSSEKRESGKQVSFDSGRTKGESDQFFKGEFE
ncbi:hypothetical protein CHR53_16495 [Neobacillus mesonae]|uniref:Uncharacterized protein n=1 Tax=Neobacillus mesonae TaxID=1193713 RepID=A0A3Q9QXN6_9BACI|nr:hypothetical protein CHR53_16495 [Neobacillus mesonae]